MKFDNLVVSVKFNRQKQFIALFLKIAQTKELAKFISPNFTPDTSFKGYVILKVKANRKIQNLIEEISCVNSIIGIIKEPKDPQAEFNFCDIMNSYFAHKEIC